MCALKESIRKAIISKASVLKDMTALIDIYFVLINDHVITREEWNELAQDGDSWNEFLKLLRDIREGKAK